MNRQFAVAICVTGIITTNAFAYVLANTNES